MNKDTLLKLEAAEMLRPEDSLVDLLELLNENLHGYQLMLRLAEQTHEQIQSGNGDDLMEKFAKRQQIQEEISARDRIIEETRQHLADTPIDDKITDLVKRSTTTLAEIQEADRKTLNLIQKERKHLREGIIMMRQGKKAARGYGKPAPRVPRFLDRRG